MSESKDYLKNYTQFEKLQSEKAKEALMDIMRAKAEQFRRYVDAEIRRLDSSGIKINVESRVNWGVKGLDLCFHLDVIAVRNDIIKDLEIKAIKYKKFTKIEEDLNSERQI